MYSQIRSNVRRSLSAEVRLAALHPEDRDFAIMHAEKEAESYQ